ncbi:MAG TPA: cobalamin B12-binding domain-containing protein [Deltaproteobacteria bacterium]|nr:cobalamin B12-binding domain-containing protein [Deltaproteobacteria bacterium]
MNRRSKVRVLIAKPGLDGHERGAQVVAYGLRDEGFEVIYTGLRQSPEQIVKAAVQEDVDVVGLSILSGAHLTLTAKVMEGLRASGASDIMVIVGGVIPEDDRRKMLEEGVAGVFTAGTRISEIAEFIRSRLGQDDPSGQGHSSGDA